MKFVYLFTFIFAINFLSVKCVYQKNCTKTCTAEKEWLWDPKTTLPGPKLPVEFDSTFAESVTPPLSGFGFSFNRAAPLELKIEGDYLVVYYETDLVLSHGRLYGGSLANDKVYIFHKAYFNIAPLYSQSAGTSYGNGENPHTGPPILVTLYFFKFQRGVSSAGIAGPTSETDPDTWVKFYLTIGVNGVIDNPLFAPLITDIKNAQTAGTVTTNMGNVFDAFFNPIKAAKSAFYTPDQDTRPGKTHTDNAVGLYLDISPTATISYDQWQDFAKLKNSDGEPLSHVEEFYPMYDCLPIGQVNEVRASIIF